jgi:hypothetical protein
VHLGTRGAASRISGNLKPRGPKWLQHAAETMIEATLQDWNDWRNGA